MPKWLATRNINSSNLQWTFACLAMIGGGLVAMAARLVSLKLDTGSMEFDELQFSLFLAISLFATLFLLKNIQKVNIVIKKACTFIADYSYSLYLTHSTVLTYIYIKYPGHDYDMQFFLIAIGVCNIIAIVFWYLFERHHRKVAKFLKKKFSAAT
jgi:peptidoglycan/LPS O-acetylase OafA/YrhL